MNNKLQELTEKLYNEGLSKGQQEAEIILGNAQSEADQIVEDARRKAATILEDAKKQASETITNADAEIRLASRQVQNEMKQAVENLVVAHSIESSIKEAFNDTEFVQSLIKIMCEKFNPEQAENIQLSLILPSDKQQELLAFAEQKIRKELNIGLEVKTDKRLKSGFKIGLRDGGYYISLTDEDFNNLFKTFLRPKTLELLFGNKPQA